MIDWLAGNWLLVTLAVAGASYFGFYVIAARERRDESAGSRRREKDC